MPNIHTTAEMLAEIRDLRTALLDANELCRSAFQVANRVAIELGTHALQSNFGALADRLHESLQRQHAVILATGGYPTAFAGEVAAPKPDNFQRAETIASAWPQWKQDYRLVPGAKPKPEEK